MMNGNNNFQMYQNSGYINNRNRKRTLILDVDDKETNDTHLGTAGTFKIDLYEPLVIDKHSEVYLDNFTSYNCNLASHLDLSAFCLKIDEFNMNSNVASSRSECRGTMFNSLVIPNEHRNPDNFQTSVVHKGKKFNYVCDINPGTIHSLSGEITDLAGLPAFHDSTTTSIFTYTIIGIDPANIARSTGGDVIQQAEGFSGVTGIVGPTGGSFPVTTNTGTTTTLHFTTNQQITSVGSVSSLSSNFHTKIPGDLANISIIFTTSDGTITITNTTGKNPAMTIIEGHGRFIAEFSIISRE
jgi:hypothetical protein